MSTPVLFGSSLAAALLVIVQGQLANVTRMDGGPFTVTCDPSRLRIPANVTVIYSLSIERTLYTSPQTQLVASFSPFPSPTVTPNIPENRLWDITGRGNNRATIKLELLVRDGTSDDAGVYRCNAAFSPTATGSSAYRVQNIPGKGNLYVPQITLDRHNSNYQHYSENEVGEPVTLTCSVLGREMLTLNWRYNVSKNGFGLKPYTYFKNTWFIGYTNASRQVSRLSFNVPPQETAYVCGVEDGENIVAEATFTIGIHPGPFNTGVSLGLLDPLRFFRLTLLVGLHVLLRSTLCC